MEAIKEISLNKVLNNPNIIALFKRLIHLSRRMSSQDQHKLSKKLAKLPLTRSTSKIKSKNAARRGKYFKKSH